MGKAIGPAEQIIRAHYPAVERHLRNKIPEPDCYDVAQDCVLAFAQKKLEDMACPRAYLWGIVKNKTKRYYEDRTRAGSISAMMIEMMPVARMSTRLSSKVARRNDVEAALQRLPLRFQQAFEFRYVEGLSYAECCEAMGVSLATAKRDVLAARQQMSAFLGKELGDDAELQRVVELYLGRRR